jgi:two-component system cell cycle sensor histidine kinase/response regulator CckA
MRFRRFSSRAAAGTIPAESRMEGRSRMFVSGLIFWCFPRGAGERLTNRGNFGCREPVPGCGMNRAVFRYVWPILFTGAALGLRMLLNPWCGERVPYVTFYVSVTLSAILGGVIPGFIATVLGTLAAIYFFVPPIHRLAIDGTDHQVIVALDFGISIVLVVLADRQRRAAAEAAEGRRMLEAVMEYLPEGLTILEAPDAKVRMMSRHGGELLGGTRESFQHKTVADYTPIFCRPDRKTPAQMEEKVGLRAIQHGEITKDVESIIKRPDGGASVILARAAPIRDSKGRIRGAVVAWRDITERKRLEEKLRESTKLQSLGVLAGGIAHDFNNLLTGVLGNASLLMMDLPEESKAWRFAQEISRVAERAARLSRQMLAYSGHGRFLVEPLDLSECIRRLVPKIESSISKHVQLKFDLADDLPAIEADASQIQELISTLVSNGGEAIGPHAGRVTIATRQLSIDSFYVHPPPLHEEIQPGTYVALEVSDTGSGMDEETVARIFDPFFTTKFMGRGLELAAAQGIVRGHKGSILVYSVPGQGTTISMLFPVAAPAVPGAAPEAGPTRAEEKSGTVLVIENEEIIRSTANDVLRQLGYSVRTATDGREGIEIFRAQKDSIAAVLLATTIPGMSSEQTLRELQEIRPDVAVVLSSGFGEAEALRRFGQHRLAGFLQKPYSMKMLAERVHEAVASVTSRS